MLNSELSLLSRIFHPCVLLILGTSHRAPLLCYSFTKILPAAWTERFVFFRHPRADTFSVKGMSTILVGTKCHRVTNFVRTQADNAGCGNGTVRIWMISGELKGCELGIHIDILYVTVFAINLLSVLFRQQTL